MKQTTTDRAVVMAMNQKENLQLLDPLTPRETDVLNQLADGLSNREIAYFLYGTIAYLAYLTLIGDYKQLASRLRPVWKLPRHQEPTHDTLWLLPFCALVLANHGDTTHSVRLLSLSVNHEMTLGFVRRLVKWSPITALQTSLRRDLGDETYERLWREGSILDLNETVRELAEWFERS